LPNPNQRRHTVQQTLSRMRLIAASGAVERPQLADILSQLLPLAAQTDWWQEEDFPAPSGDERHARYLISQDADQTLALYLNVMRPGRRIAPHNHTTWATIAAVNGVEFNHLYQRLDDGSRSGVARLAAISTVAVQPGSGLALLPEDIHAVEIRGEQPIRHLHLYGRALEALTERICFDLDTDSYALMPVGVTTLPHCNLAAS
jgi:predicted metal-dependent enzyme (double-stranded beta helix superfamily)